MKKQIEPMFLNLPCNGKDLERVKELKEKIDALNLMMSFYKLDRKDQLVMAAVITEMTTDREYIGDL